MGEPTPFLRKIIHVDMDAFYASVEQRDNPALRGKPLVVGGNPDSRSVVCSASYEARAYGVRSAIPCSHARRLCPDAIFVSPNFEKYREASRGIRAIFLRHTPLVEPLSLDEAYLDVTQELTGIATATDTARAIRREIREELSLTASAGVAPNKFLAKIASDWRKPDGLFVIKPHQIEDFLTPLPVGKIHGVGKAMEQSLAGHGIRTVGDLRQIEADQLTIWYGKFGHRLWELARGIDDRPVEPERETKSVSAEDTFDHDLDFRELSGPLGGLSERVFRSCEKHQRFGRTVTVKLRAGDFRTETRRITLPEPIASGVELFKVGQQLLGRFSFAPATRYRLLGIGLSNFTERTEEAESPQPLLFEENQKSEIRNQN
jgi:DNA polymerase-4